MRFGEVTSPELSALDKEKLILVCPLGSCEQHGPHLPLATDTLLISRIAEAVEARLPERVMLAPTIWTGSSQSHLRFQGVVSLDALFFAEYVVRLCRGWLRDGFRRVLLLNGHGGNVASARVALRALKDESPDALVTFSSYWDLGKAAVQSVRESGPGGIGHACEMETSLMLWLAPDLVRMDKVASGGRFRASRYTMQDLYAPGPVDVAFDHHDISCTGVHGNPELASADKGRQFFDGIVDAVAGFVEEFRTWDVRPSTGREAGE